jgi:hypothetical protein
MRGTHTGRSAVTLQYTLSDLANAGHDLTLGQMPVAHQPLAAVVGQFVGMAAEQGRHFGIYGLRQQRSRALRKTSVSGSVKVPGWESWKTLVSVTAYHSFGGEVEASNTPTIRRLTPSCRLQLSPIAPPVKKYEACILVRKAVPSPARGRMRMAVKRWVH